MFLVWNPDIDYEIVGEIIDSNHRKVVISIFNDNEVGNTLLDR
ncbi:hypothetical protein [Thomasclavelia cocleata]|nr:hypothetical protein [Thomasclavelia cocleata]